jgi:hypothetical protein
MGKKKAKEKENGWLSLVIDITYFWTPHKYIKNTLYKNKLKGWKIHTHTHTSIGRTWIMFIKLSNTSEGGSKYLNL